MNTSTARQRYTVITVTERDYMELTADPGYAVLGYQTFEYVENNTVTRLFTVFIKRVSEVKKNSYLKPLQAKVISVNDPLDKLKENKVKFEVGSFYDYGFIIEIVKRSEKTITYRTPGQPGLTIRKIQDTDPRYETFYPDKNSICSSRNKVRESLPESQIKTVATTDNNLSTFKAGQIYKIGDRVDIALRITEANDKTVKVHFLIEVYDKKADCFQWWESKENKIFRVTNYKTLQEITLNYSTFMNIGKVSVRSNQLNPVNYQHSVKTAINNNSLPKEVKNKLLFLNGNKSGSYYSYDNK